VKIEDGCAMQRMPTRTTACEIRAAAQASDGEFKEAIKSEKKALSLGQRLKWDVTAMNDRMAHYTAASQPWYGTLLEF
jgi:hypothetical protein